MRLTQATNVSNTFWFDGFVQALGGKQRRRARGRQESSADMAGYR